MLLFFRKIRCKQPVAAAGQSTQACHAAGGPGADLHKSPACQASGFSALQNTGNLARKTGFAGPLGIERAKGQRGRSLSSC